MTVSKEKETTYIGSQKDISSDFEISKKLGGIPNEIFTMILTATIANFNVVRILVDCGSTYYIMYVELFEKLGMKKEKLCPYEEYDLQTFNGTVSILGDTST